MKLNEIIKNTGIVYREGDHTYRRETDGREYVSCTSVLKAIPKDYLAKWGANEAVALIDKEWNVFLEYSLEEKKQILLRAKNAHIVKSNVAKQTGTQIHNWIEQHIRGNNTQKPVGFEKYIDEFLEWEKNNVEEWIACELMVASHEMEVAGRLDAVARLRGGLNTIIDFKTSSSIYPEYYLQTGAYWKMLKEMGFGADQRMIIRIPKEEIRKVYNKESKKYHIEENHLEVEVVATDLLEDIQIFNYLRLVYPWIKKYE
jgi:hypothetical protein